MAERCPDCGLAKAPFCPYSSGCMCMAMCNETGDALCEERAEALALRAKLTKLEAVVEAQAKVIATGEAYLECDGSPAELAAFYDAAKAELEKAR